jgi:tetratricopeptide (TPR) repeat protein
VSPIKTSSAAHTLPPSAESLIVLRKVVELYGKAVEAKASVDPSLAALTPAAKEEMLRFVVLSPSWASVAASALARTLILFAEVFGSGHASLANVWKLQGLLAVQIGDFATGQTAFMAALSLCSDAGVDATITAGLRFNLGVCCSMAGDYATAVKHFRAASAVYVDKHGKDHELTRQVDDKLQQALRCGMQEQYTSLYSSALRAVSERRYADAHATLEKCLELVPEEPTTAYSLAACCCRLRCCGGGISWFQKALEWGFDDWTTALHDPDLAPLRAQPVFHTILQEAGVDIHSSDEDVDVD